ncbi:MAG: isoprenyl transferase [Acidimicrobiia bacterium]|nr:MAG: isoprenyl transferase [Acidimicrobiia bacterium]
MIDWLTTDVDLDRVPTHVGIIMDGNGRWANARGLHRTQGHAAGEPALFDVVHGALDLGIRWLTVYTFSTENWSRDEFEVDFLMQFNVDLLERRRDELNDLGVRVIFMGDVDDDRVPEILRQRIKDAEDLTAHNTTMTMVFAFNYGGRIEIADAARAIAEGVADGTLALDTIDVDTIAAHLYEPEMPDPDLVIRTSGELRTSNFLLWQAAYSEYVFTDVLWPDFDRHVLAACIGEYQKRDRRYGGAIDDSLTEVER